MDFVQPLRDDLSVDYDSITYDMGYYATPTLLTGVTDETYAEYNAATTYDVGDFCTLDALKGVYRSSLASNVGNYPPANPNSWTFWSPINSYNMLAVDEFIGSQTTGTDIVMEFDFSQITAFALIDLVFDDLLIEVIDNTTAVTVYTENVSGTGIGADSYYEYFYSTFGEITRLYRGDFDWYADATLRITFTGVSSIGAVVMGLIETLGCTLYGTALKFEDTSTITKSEVTGFRTVNRYGNVRVLDVNVLFNTSEFNSIANKVEKIIGKNILFVPTEDDSFSEMITIGYFENFNIPVEGETLIETSSTIIGVI